jgi:hypothetical protein
LSIHAQRSPCAGWPAQVIRSVLFPTAEFSVFPQGRFPHSPVVPPPARMARRIGVSENNAAAWKLPAAKEDGVDFRLC